MIEYLEVRAKATREIIGIIDGAKSIIWHSVFFGVGDFEIYVLASAKHIELLKEGNYITRTDDDEIGIIESVESEAGADGYMLVASGRFAKAILERRFIYKIKPSSPRKNIPTILSGKVESAARSLVANNLISCTFDTDRNIPFIKLGALKNYPEIIEGGDDGKIQVSHENLLEYTDNLLQEYDLGARMTLDSATNEFEYNVIKGADRSTSNTAGNEAVIFSKEFDNLLESRYRYTDETKRTCAIVGGEGEGSARIYSVIKGSATGIERREMFLDASSISRTYEDDDGTEKTLTAAAYATLISREGRAELKTHTATHEFEGAVNVSGGMWTAKEDYFLGDIVTFQDNALDKYASARIIEITEVQDENGYELTPIFDYIQG